MHQFLETKSEDIFISKSHKSKQGDLLLQLCKVFRVKFRYLSNSRYGFVVMDRFGFVERKLNVEHQRLKIDKHFFMGSMLLSLEHR